MKFDLQKATLSKRFSAFLFDGILLVVLVTGLALLLSMAVGYDGYSQTLSSRYEVFEKEYGVSFDTTLSEYEAFTPEQKENYDKASQAISQDLEAVYAYNMMVNLIMVIVTGSILLAFLILEFAVPLKLGNGQTLGKKIFGIALMREDGVKLNTVSLFVRTVLGKFTVETMIPLLIIVLILFGGLGILGTILLGLILLLQVILMIASHTNALIHDKLANTIAVDMASQMIFGTELELIAYKERMQAEKAARQGY